MNNLNFDGVANEDRVYPSGLAEQPCAAHPDILQINGLIELLATPACYFNQDGGVVSINDAWLDYAGLSAQASSQLQWVGLVHAEQRYEALSKLRAGPDAAGHATLECRLVSRRRVERWFILNLHSVGTGWLCTCTDIHDSKIRERQLESRASMQTDMLNVSVDCIKLIATNGNLLHMNRAGCRALGLHEDSGFGMPWLPLLPEDVWAPGNIALESARKGIFSRFSGRSVIPGQCPQYWDNMLTPILDNDGKTTAILCVSREVTREREALNLLQRSEERLAIAARVGGLGVWDYDIARDALQGDESWYRILGLDPGRPISTIAQLRPMIHPDDVDKATDIAKNADELVSSGRDYGIEYRIVRPDGEIRWVRSAAYFQHEAGGSKRAIGFVLDITEARRSELALRDENRMLERDKALFRRQSLEDSLTGVHNRRYLNEELERICDEDRYRAEKICVVLIDIDHFKLYNDRYGHPEGDRALQLVAQVLKNFCRRSDLVARYGGEEFMIVWRDVTNPVPLLEGVRNAIRQLGIAHGSSPEGRLTLSCGCAVVDLDRGDLSASWLIKRSDDALYEAKSQGRNRYVVHQVGHGR